jgi:hypothetical protein
MKTYGYNGLAGCVAQVKNRETGRLVGLYRNDQADLDDDDGAWSTVCEPHGMLVNHATLALARSHLAAPGDWCEDCAALARDGQVADGTVSVTSTAPEKALEFCRTRLGISPARIGRLTDAGPVSLPGFPPGTRRFVISLVERA